MDRTGKPLLIHKYGNGFAIAFPSQRLIIMAHETIAALLRVRMAKGNRQQTCDYADYAPEASQR
jgi:hypothetical protein